LLEKSRDLAYLTLVRPFDLIKPNVQAGPNV
jgi:hypothetical protein